jgi:hypothetical protein
MFIPILQTAAPPPETISVNSLDATIRLVGAFIGGGLLLVALLNFWLRWRKNGLEMELLRAQIADITTTEGTTNAFPSLGGLATKTRA